MVTLNRTEVLTARRQILIIRPILEVSYAKIVNYSSSPAPQIKKGKQVKVRRELVVLVGSLYDHLFKNLACIRSLFLQVVDRFIYFVSSLEAPSLITQKKDDALVI